MIMSGGGVVDKYINPKKKSVVFSPEVSKVGWQSAPLNRKLGERDSLSFLGMLVVVICSLGLTLPPLAVCSYAPSPPKQQCQGSTFPKPRGHRVDRPAVSRIDETVLVLL